GVVDESGFAKKGGHSAGVARHFFFQAEDGIRGKLVTGVQTCALPIYSSREECGERGIIAAEHHLKVARSRARPRRSLARRHRKRSEERRVGKECRDRCAKYHYRNKEEP